MSLGTPWGLFRHYWVVAKLVISVVATVFLLVHMQPVGHIAPAVSETALREGELDGLRMQLVMEAVAACVAVLGATVLSVFKPGGLTSLRRQVSESGGRWCRTSAANAWSPESRARWRRRPR